MSEHIKKYIEKFQKEKKWGQILLSFENGMITMIKEIQTFTPENFKKKLDKLK